MRGRITKGIAGFYYVKSGETIYRCKARGIFKAQGVKPAVGDEAEFEIIEGNDASLRVMEKCGMERMSYTDTVEYRGQTHNCIYYHIQK